MPMELKDSAPDLATVKLEKDTANADRKTERTDKGDEKEKLNSKSQVDKSIREKLESLTPRQRAFMTEFLNLKLEERDLIVDVGNNLFQYFKMKGMDL